MEAIIEKYKDAKLKFYSYYKYTFTYKGEFNGLIIVASYGGDAGSIYRFDASADEELTLGEICPDSIRVTDKDGNVVDELYDY